MSHLPAIPSEFQVFSIAPVIKIRYRSPARSKILLFLLFLPVIALFLAHCALLFCAFHEAIARTATPATRLLSYNTKQAESIIAFTLSFLLIGILCAFALWTLFKRTELNGTADSLILTHTFLGTLQNRIIPAKEIDRLQLSPLEASGTTWQLAAICDRPRPYRYRTSTLKLYEHNNLSACLWLGRVLSSFYNLQLHSAIYPQTDLSVTQFPPHQSAPAILSRNN